MDGNNSCNRSNRVGELDRLSKLDDRNVVVLSSRFGVKQQDIMLSKYDQFSSMCLSICLLINHNLVVAVVIWM